MLSKLERSKSHRESRVRVETRFQTFHRVHHSFGVAWSIPTGFHDRRIISDALHTCWCVNAPRSLREKRWRVPKPQYWQVLRSRKRREQANGLFEKTLSFLL